MIESQEILNMLYNKLPKDEQEMMNNYLYCEFGCEVIFKNTDHNNKDDLQPIKVKGYQIKLAVAHLYNHPLLKIDKLMNGIYPEYWLEIEDLEKEQYKAKIKKLDPKKNSKHNFRLIFHF